MSGTTDIGWVQHQATRIVAKAWADEGFKHRLMSDPNGTLQAEGVAVPPGLKLVVHEDDGSAEPAGTADTLYFTLPPKPDNTLSDAELDAVAGGSGWPPGTSQQTIQHVEQMCASAGTAHISLPP